MVREHSSLEMPARSAGHAPIPPSPRTRSTRYLPARTWQTWIVGSSAGLMAHTAVHLACLALGTLHRRLRSLPAVSGRGAHVRCA